MYVILPINTENPNLLFYKIKQIPKIDILYFRYARKNNGVAVIFRLYSKDIVKPIHYYKQAVLYIFTKFNLGKM